MRLRGGENFLHETKPSVWVESIPVSCSLLCCCCFKAHCVDITRVWRHNTQHNAVNRGPVLASVMMLRSPACCRCSSSRAGLGSREAPAAVFGGWSVLLETVSELSITFCIIASCNYTIAVQIGKQKTHDWHILLISWNRKKEKTCLWTLETQLKLTEQNIWHRLHHLQEFWGGTSKLGQLEVTRTAQHATKETVSFLYFNFVLHHSQEMFLGEEEPICQWPPHIFTNRQNPNHCVTLLLPPT